jgi:hypothetical protein
MTKKSGLVMGWCLVFLLGGLPAYAANPPHDSKIQSNTMAPSGHPKKHYGAPIQQPILKHVAPKPKAKSSHQPKPEPQLKSTPLPEAAPNAG